MYKYLYIQIYRYKMAAYILLHVLYCSLLKLVIVLKHSLLLIFSCSQLSAGKSFLEGPLFPSGVAIKAALTLPSSEKPQQ
jgi:hypothetical protein